MTLDDFTVLVCDIVAEQDLRTLATIRESPRVFDIAVLSPRGASWLLRCAAGPDENDYLALATILAQGPLVRAALLYCRPAEGTMPADQIASRLIGVETCSIERLPDLLADWKREERDQ